VADQPLEAQLDVRHGKGSRRKGPNPRLVPLINGADRSMRWFIEMCSASSTSIRAGMVSLPLFPSDRILHEALTAGLGAIPRWPRYGTITLAPNHICCSMPLVSYRSIGRRIMTDLICPHRIAFPEADLRDLRERLARTRWPEAEPVPDWSQGVPLGYLREWRRYWADEYDWPATEARLNRIPQIVTAIDGLDVHALHVRSPHPEAVPLVLTHGWPGSFLEFEGVLDGLTDPTAHGGEPVDAFHVVVPSLPGYGFSGRPAEPGWDIHRVARAWTELMTRLGYDRFIAAGSDWGTSVSTSIALNQPHRLLGLHLIPPLAPPDRTEAYLTKEERRALADLDERNRTGSGYSAVHATRPQTLGYALLDSPVALCAWILEKVWTWTDNNGDLNAVLARDRVLDNITLYWLTRTGASATRLYWESITEVTEWSTTSTSDQITVPTASSVFPAEVPRPSRRWAAQRFTNIVHWGQPKQGGHFAAWEQPELFIAEARAARSACLAAQA
jgi:pimeloyl-ACP methyl ester carboxylesterase